MFIIFNKDKILSYLISISTVAILFVMSFAITKNNNETLKTSTNIVFNDVQTEQGSKNNSIQNIVNEAEQEYNNVKNANNIDG